MKTTGMARCSLALAALLAGLSGVAVAQDTVLLSTQLRPIEEAQKMREVILKGFTGKVNFVPEEDAPFVTRMKAEIQTGKPTASAIAALHGDLSPFVSSDGLQPLDDLMGQLAERQLPPVFVRLGKLGTDHQLYIPWMQATYIMVANKQALPFLPQGANIDALTYDQLKEWGANIQKATGERRLGFPAGPKGLLNRFFQGYLYPAYTGALVTKFRSPEAAQAWQGFKDIWAYASPRSTSYDFMQEPLLTGEVWVAWDHVARLKDALAQKPDEFVTFPAPAGPKGRGFMPVVAGLAIPKGAPNVAGAKAVIEYLTRPEVQITTLRETGFYPVVSAPFPADMPRSIQMAADAVQKQFTAKDALPSLLPVGLGDKGGEFSKVFMDAFQLIVLRGQEIPKVLDRQAETLRALMKTAGAACWSPDPASDGPCPVM